MHAEDVMTIIHGGEDSFHQFKVMVNSPNALAAEMVAFANSAGGLILIGVADSGAIEGVSSDELRRLNQLIANTASNHVKNPINPITENVVDGKLVVVIHIAEGSDKPYMDQSGQVWVKCGADKHKVTSKEELRRLFQSSGTLYADELVVEETSVAEVHPEKFRQYFQKVYNLTLEEAGLPLERILENLHLAKAGKLNQAGLLLFGKQPTRFRPTFIIKAVSFFGDFIGDPTYRDSEDIEGDLEYQFTTGMAFLLRNLKKTQQGQNFNSLGILEVSRIALEELLQNALIHRDYFKNAPIRLLIFDHRIEIISPGTLPNSLTVENIKYGNSAIRNPILASFAAKMLPYRGLGSGIIRAMHEQPNLELIDDRSGEQFKAMIPWPEERSKNV